MKYSTERCRPHPQGQRANKENKLCVSKKKKTKQKDSQQRQKTSITEAKPNMQH